MAEPGITYQPWRSLDGSKRYYLVDTMELLELYRRNSRLASMVVTVGGDRTLLLIPAVVDECVKVFDRYKPDTSSREYMYVGDESGQICSYLEGPATEEDFDVEPSSRGDFDRLLAQTLDWCDIAFAAAEPEPGTLNAAKSVYAEKKYKNKKGEPLSPVDCIILRLAVENGNMDVVTDDMALARAVSAECGAGRASNALAAYFGRLNMTARFLSRALNLDFVDCKPVRDDIEYSAPSYGRLIEVNLSPDGMSASYRRVIDELGDGKPDGSVSSFMSFVQMVVVDWYCACGDADWKRFDKEWIRTEWDVGAMKITGKTRRPHYDTAKSVLNEYRGRYCACSRPDERSLHEEFRKIMAETKGGRR
ncbi:MAG: hypothetical protein IS632_08930 [Thaumarchaeota archaeon]|nr:hypothetical protein [Nitrososphaerota archaeon]